MSIIIEHRASPFAQGAGAALAEYQRRSQAFEGQENLWEARQREQLYGTIGRGIGQVGGTLALGATLGGGGGDAAAAQAILAGGGTPTLQQADALRRQQYLREYAGTQLGIPAPIEERQYQQDIGLMRERSDLHMLEQGRPTRKGIAQALGRQPSELEYLEAANVFETQQGILEEDMIHGAQVSALAGNIAQMDLQAGNRALQQMAAQNPTLASSVFQKIPENVRQRMAVARDRLQQDYTPEQVREIARFSNDLQQVDRAVARGEIDETEGAVQKARIRRDIRSVEPQLTVKSPRPETRDQKFQSGRAWYAGSGADRRLNSIEWTKEGDKFKSIPDPEGDGNSYWHRTLDRERQRRAGQYAGRRDSVGQILRDMAEESILVETTPGGNEYIAVRDPKTGEFNVKFPPKKTGAADHGMSYGDARKQVVKEMIDLIDSGVLNKEDFTQGNIESRTQDLYNRSRNAGIREIGDAIDPFEMEAMKFGLTTTMAPPQQIGKPRVAVRVRDHPEQAWTSGSVDADQLDEFIRDYEASGAQVELVGQ